MKYFTQDYIEFFKELEHNNHKEWFHSQKKRYEQRVKQPFEKLVADMISALQKHDESLHVEAKDCILRINRDIRFAKDKTPYNLHCTAFVSRGGRKDKSIPGIFIRISPEMVGIMGGCFGPDKHQLTKIRTAIANDPKSFRKLIEATDFKKRFGVIKGETMKRIPKDLQSAVDAEPLIANKQFYFVTELESAAITSEDLMDQIMEHWRAMLPVNEYLNQAIK